MLYATHKYHGKASVYTWQRNYYIVYDKKFEIKIKI